MFYILLYLVIYQFLIDKEEFVPKKSRTIDSFFHRNRETSYLKFSSRAIISNDDRRSFESKGITRGGETEFSRRGKVALAPGTWSSPLSKGYTKPLLEDCASSRFSSFFLFNPSPMEDSNNLLNEIKSAATVLSTRGHRGFLIMSRP